MLDEDDRYHARHGVEMESEYPYLTRVAKKLTNFAWFTVQILFWQDDKCHYEKGKTVATISNWYFSSVYYGDNANDEQQMKQDVAKIGPLAACINVT